MRNRKRAIEWKKDGEIQRDKENIRDRESERKKLIEKLLVP